MIIGLDLDHFRDPRLRRLAAHWLEQRRGAVLPAREAIDPTLIPGLAPHVWTCRHFPESGRFRCISAGEEITTILGDVAGRFVEDFIPYPAVERVRLRYRAVLTLPAVMHCIGRVYLTNGDFGDGERAVFPLAGTGGQADTLLGVTLYVMGRGRSEGLFASEQMTVRFTPLLGGPPFDERAEHPPPPVVAVRMKPEASLRSQGQEPDIAPPPGERPPEAPPGGPSERPVERPVESPPGVPPDAPPVMPPETPPSPPSEVPPGRTI